MSRLFRKLAFEAAHTLHFAAAVTVLTTLFFHAAHARPARIYLITGASSWGCALVLRNTSLAYRSLGTQSTILGYEEGDEVVQVVVDIRRPWKFGPGQYAYLTIPTVSTTAVFQSHPFMITWWDKSHRRAYFLVSPQEGFSRSLLLHRDGRIRGGRAYDNGRFSLRSRLTTMIEGPYGQCDDLGSFGTVIMIATGLGITAQIPYIRHLLEAHRNREVRTQKIALYWQMRSKYHCYWVLHWMDELMIMDKNFVSIRGRRIVGTAALTKAQILEINMYITEPTSRRHDNPRIHEDWKVVWQRADFDLVVQMESMGNKGRMVVTSM